MRRLLGIAYFLEVGLLLVLVPWSAIWDRNYFAGSVPLLRTMFQNNFVRGGVSGLGILNLYVGFADLGALVSTRRIASARGPQHGAPNAAAALGTPRHSCRDADPARPPAIVQADGSSAE